MARRTTKKKSASGAGGKARKPPRSKAALGDKPPATNIPAPPATGGEPPLSRPAPAAAANASRRLTAPGSPIATEANEDPLRIVGIGASAGGLEALEEFFLHVPPSPDLTFVVVSHLDPAHASYLHQLLAKFTALPVTQVTGSTRVDANHVYVAPPAHEVAIAGGVLELTSRPTGQGAHLPIDAWFRSLAADRRHRAIGVVLSGNGSDGTLGVRAIKGESGMVVAQDPAQAKYSGMPASAIATGLVDFVLPARDMPAKLIAYAHAPLPRAEAPQEQAAEALTVSLRSIFALLRSRTRHDFSQYKASTIYRRIERRMSLHEIDTHALYVKHLQEHPSEIDLLFKDLLIGVTSFFRDADAFAALADKAIPALIDAGQDDTPIRVWVPGCSTGEEAYSLAMSFSEVMARKGRGLPLQIFATDLDPQAIEEARTGSYPSGIAADVKPDYLARFFRKENDRYRIKKEIRECVVFAPQDLIADPPFTRLDLLSCRNLLIYMQGELQKRLLPMFHYALKPRGVLFLGNSETLGTAAELFEAVDRRWKVFRRLPVPAVLDAPRSVPPAPHPQDVPMRSVAADAVLSLEGRLATDQFARLLADLYAPASVLVNAAGNIVYYHGRTGTFLEPSQGEPTHNLLAMARNGLQAELAAVMRKALLEDTEVIRQAVQVRGDGGTTSFDIAARKLSHPLTLRGLTLVTFSPTSAPDAPPRPHPPVLGSKTRRTAREIALERELEHIKETHARTVEELETANEELKSSNEEMQSTNEEMQSTNEELETSKEEMQSLNEELQMLNAEFQGKIEELSQANDDMTNLLNATDIATLFLDNNLKIKRFTAETTRLFRLIPTDVGRPLTDIVANLNYQDLEQDARAVLRTLAFREREVQTRDGAWFVMRLMPYRTADNVIDGLALTFVDVTKLKDTEALLRSARDGMEPRLWARAASAMAVRDADSPGALQLLRALDDAGNSDHQLRLLAAVAPDTLWSTDLDLRLTFIGGTVAWALARDPADLQAGTLLDYMEARSRAAFMRAVKVALADGDGLAPVKAKPTEVDIELVRTDGSLVQTTHKFWVARDAAGEAIGLLGVARGLAQAVERGTRDRNRAAMLEPVVSVLREPLVALDSSLNVLSASPGFLQLLGLPASGELRGKPFFDLNDGAWDEPELRAWLGDVAATDHGAESSFEHTLVRAGNRRVALHARCLRQPPAADGAVLLSVHDLGAPAASG